MPMQKNRAVVLAKIEAPYGTDSIPTGAANAIFCEEPSVEPILKKLERNQTRQVMGAVAPLTIAEGVKISFSVELAGSGAAGTAPHIGPLLRACNMEETLVVDTSAAYAPSSDSFAAESVTIYFYRHLILHKVTGCRGTFKLSGKVNEIAKLMFEFTGIYNGPVDAALPSPIYPSVVPPIFRAAAFSLDAYAAVISALEIDLGNAIAKRMDANADSGILEYFVSDRKVSGSIDPEVPTLATKDYWAILMAGTQTALTATVGNVAGNRCVITAPKVSISDLKYADREQILTYAMPLSFNPNAGDDELVLTFN
jgi:hypothetical protein